MTSGSTASPTPQKKLSPEEMEKAMERLTRPPTRNAQLEPLPLKPVKPLTTGEIEESANRLCNGALEHKARTQEALLERIAPKRPSSVMSTEERDTSVQRLYYGTVRTNKEKLDKLQKKYLHKGVVAPKDSEKVQHSIQQLFYADQERTKSRREKLIDKYVTPTGPPRHTISKERLAAMLDRLGTAPS